MIITDNFVFINYPKTGSTFVRSVLHELNNRLQMSDFIGKPRYYAQKIGVVKKPFFEEKLVPQIRNSNARYLELDPHGICDQIPEEHKNKKIISVFRNPYDKLLSSYYYGDWKKVDYFHPQKANSKYPNYPDLSFNEFIELFYSDNPGARHVDIKSEVKIGTLSLQFIKFFFKNPFEVINNKINENYFMSGEYKKDMYDVKFLNFNQLNHELYDYLISEKYKPELINFILSLQPINTSDKKSNEEQTMFNETTLQLIENFEWPLLKYLAKFHHVK